MYAEVKKKKGQESPRIAARYRFPNERLQKTVRVHGISVPLWVSSGLYGFLLLPKRWISSVKFPLSLNKHV